MPSVEKSQWLITKLNTGSGDGLRLLFLNEKKKERNVAKFTILISTYILWFYLDRRKLTKGVRRGCRISLSCYTDWSQSLDCYAKETVRLDDVWVLCFILQCVYFSRSVRCHWCWWRVRVCESVHNCQVPYVRLWPLRPSHKTESLMNEIVLVKKYIRFENQFYMTFNIDQQNLIAYIPQPNCNVGLL